MIKPLADKQTIEFKEKRVVKFRKLIKRNAKLALLIEQNSKLKADKAWLTLGPGALQRELDECVNVGRLIPICTKCKACYKAHRWDTSSIFCYEVNGIFRESYVGSPSPCIVLKCLVFQAKKLGLTVELVDLDEVTPIDPVDLINADRDCHFVIFSEEGGWRLSYGMKLRHENFHLNPCIELLVQLKLLFSQEEFFFADGKDYADLYHPVDA